MIPTFSPRPQGGGTAPLRDRAVFTAIKNADVVVAIQTSVTGCLSAMARAAQADDADGVLSAAELVGDAVVNYAAFLKNARQQ